MPLSAALRSEMPGPIPQDKLWAPSALLSRCLCQPCCSLLWHLHRCLYRHQLQRQRSITGATGALRKHQCQRSSSRYSRRQSHFPCQHQIRRLFPSLCQRRSCMQCSRLRSRLIRLQRSRLLWHRHLRQCPCHLSQRRNKPFLYLLCLWGQS